MNTTNLSANILIVDDTSEHLYKAGNILKSLGIPIRVALTGKCALELIKEQKPTVILLDIMLKDINGFQICQNLKSNPEYADIAIIFVTGISEVETIQEGFRIGGQDYVTKPYHQLELIARVQNQLELTRQSVELKYAYHELDHFCSNVSHDLKSPLLVIQQLATMLTDSVSQESSSEVQTIITMLTDKCQNTLTMVERLLELSHITQMSLHENTINIQKLFNTIFSELILLEPERKIHISIDDTIPFLTADKELLKYLVQNIMSNAIKFTRNRPIAQITVTGELKSNDFTLSIQDNGAGFDPSYTNKLFQVFSRLHNASDFEGSGVGLTIVARIMNMHGGTAEIVGALDKGATILLRFPLRRVSDIQSA
ncbi:MAG: response regulator [Lachnospiraceae bacterium]|nr:response regulator [Lachnospiraceae bacterium]